MTMQLPDEVKRDLPDLIQLAIAVLSDLHNAPDELSVPSALAVANFAAQGLADVNYLGWPKPGPISEYFVVLSASGTLKSTTYEDLIVGINDWEKLEKERYKREMLGYELKKAAYDLAKKKLKYEEGDDVNQLIATLPPEPEPPCGHIYKMTKPSMNGMMIMMNDVPFSCLFNDDAADWFNSYSFQDKNRDVEIIAIMSKTFSGGKVARETGVREDNVRFNDKRLSGFLMVQKGLAGFFTNPKFIEQGITNRFLLTEAGKFKLPQMNFDSDAVEARENVASQLSLFHAQILKMLLKTRDVQDRQRQLIEHIEGSLATADWSNKTVNKLPVLQFNKHDGSRKLLEAYGNEMIEERYDDVKNGTLVGVYTRCFEHVVRLAATLALFDNPDTLTISERYTRAAIGLMRWFMLQRKAVEVSEGTTKSKVVLGAEALVEYLRHKTVDGSATFTKLQQSGPRAFKDLEIDTRIAAAKEAASRGWVEIEFKAPKTPSGVAKITGIKLKDLVAE